MLSIASCNIPTQTRDLCKMRIFAAFSNHPTQPVPVGDVFEEIFGASVSKCICVLQLIVDDLELFPEACHEFMCQEHTERFKDPINTSWGFVLSVSKQGIWMRVCLNGLTFFGIGRIPPIQF